MGSKDTQKDIKSSGFNVGELFTDIRYVTDPYQRDYAWGSDEVRTLVRDLCKAFLDGAGNSDAYRNLDRTPQYFLGPYVYYTQSQRQHCLVDGQQRFVTLQLILMQLRSLALEDGHTRVAERLARSITTADGGFAIGIDDHAPVLSAIYEGRAYEPGPGESLSRRNLWQRSGEIAQQLPAELPADESELFVRWLLDRVVLVGIRAADQDHGFRMFETMNDRGAQLTTVDLLKSYLLSHAGGGEEKLNAAWQQMLREVTTDRADSTASAHFLKSVVLARYALTGTTDELERIDRDLNGWVRGNERLLGLDRKRPASFRELVNDLLELARLYRPFVAASQELKQADGLETVYFNRRNDLRSQDVAILAAIRPKDTPTAAKDKGRLVARFIDRWYALGVLRDLEVQERDLASLVHGTLVPMLRSCVSVDDVKRVLGRRAAADPVDLVKEASTFGLRANNSRQVRYILARTAAFVDTGCGRETEIVRFLDSGMFHIEHLWANKPERQQGTVLDGVAFRALRNQLGGLGLLRGPENSSLQAVPLWDKENVYNRNNALLATVFPAFTANNTVFHRFKHEHGLDALLRSFGSTESMVKVIETRQRLYLTLCQLIWNPARLDFIIPPIPVGRVAPPRRSGSSRRRVGNATGADVGSAAVPPRPARSSRTRSAPNTSRPRPRRRTDVARMIADGVLQPGTRIVLNHRGTDHWATLDADGGVGLDEAPGTPYGTLDAAGAMVKGTRTCRGMTDWQVVQPDGTRLSLAVIRDRARG